MNSEMLRQICSSLATVTEDIKWRNDIVFRSWGLRASFQKLFAP
jgi:hypothetical protein